LKNNKKSLRNSAIAAGVVLAVGASSVHALKPTEGRHAASPGQHTGTPLVEPIVPVGDTLFRERPGNTPVLPPAARAQVASLAQSDYEQEVGVKLTRLTRGPHTRKLVALTFDDGPHQGYTIQLLQVLKALHVKATFFLVGKQVDKFPSLVQMEVLEGHELGNHTYDHVDLTQIPPELIGFELDECDAAIRRATGSSARFFRPPGGQFAPQVVREASRRHFITTLWSDDPGDYAKPGADVVLQRTMDHLDNGSIILLHDGIPDTMSVLPTIVSEARKRGFEFVTMSELAKAMQADQKSQLARAVASR
jgi:peptidoglycan/xylan/chitin deacetylase (PgdA/CDA1 family)